MDSVVEFLMKNTEVVNELFSNLDEIAVSYSSYEYGLPSDDGAKARMRESVYVWLLNTISLANKKE